MTRHRHPESDIDVCERCATNENVHGGLCRRCREFLLGPGIALGPEHPEKPHQADTEPLHNPPWRRRGA